MNTRFLRGLALIFSVMLGISAAAQEKSVPDEYRTLMNDGYYQDAVVQIERQIDEYNANDVAEKEVPANFISFQALEEKQNINELFSRRQVPVRFKREDTRMRQLHFDAGYCHEKTGNYLNALGHYNQSFLYKKIIPDEDAEVFYRISQVYRTMGYQQSYLNELEIAHYLKPADNAYVRELADGYYAGKNPKMAILYYEKFVKNSGDGPEDHSVYIKLANLNTSLERYLETEKYYLLYLEKNPDDPDVLYALCNLCYRNTGHFDLALEKIDKLKTGSKDISADKLSKLNELAGDIYFKREKYPRAIEAYKAAIEHENGYRESVDTKRSQLEELEKRINILKAELIKKNDYVKYEEYQDLTQEKTKLAYELMMMEYELKKYNPGKLRWQTAESYERLKDYQPALEYYRQCIAENYRQNEARTRMTKIQLILQRGY